MREIFQFIFKLHSHEETKILNCWINSGLDSRSFVAGVDFYFISSRPPLD